MNAAMVVKWGRVSADRAMKNMFSWQAFDLPTGDNASGVGVDYDLRKDFGLVGGSSR